ncbi:MAG: InlB B-repeat-containing protein, partial [Acholeplasmatales bacterium]|nr:InlB B-repeat-containing protein [Acholeplasmatales bacterium]
MKKRLFALIVLICTLLLASCDFPFGGGSTSNNDVTTSTPIDETTTIPIDETTIVETNTQNEEKYIITWKNYDGAILKIDNNVKKGSIPSYTGEKPYSPYDGNYYYEFIGWSPELKEVDSDITYVAQFKSTKYINVNWIYGNNTYCEIVMPGTTPSYSGPTPTLDLDDGKEYVFVRWEPAVGEVYEDISYTAIFEPKISEYKINYELNYGENNGDNPASYKNTDSNITLKDPKRVGHNFVGWYYNDNYITEIDTSIHADITITAIWEPDEELALFDYTYDGTTYTITGIKDKLVEEINIPDYIDVIESEAFKGCSKLKTILIPGSVKRINDGAFADCDSLSYIIVPKQIEYFSINTFDSNSKTKVFYSGNKDEWNNLLNGDSLTQNVYFYSVGEPDYNQWNYVNNKPTIRKYTVVFNNYDGTPISTYKYEYGEIIIAPDTPVKEADKTYTYKFAGWGSEVSICKGDYTYQAEFTPKYIDYVITFVNYDGTVILSSKYHYGATAIEVPENPSREADNTYTYGFAGWDSYIKECTEDKTYTATYIPIYIEYTITFINYDNSIWSSDNYHYGDTINEPSTPSKESNETYTYEFAGWDKEVVACAGNATYYATYKSIYIEYEIAFIDYDDSLISAKKYHYGDTVIQPNNPTRESDEMFTYEFAGWGREIETCKGNDVYKATYKSDYVEYEVIFVNYDGTVLSTNKYHYGDHIIVPPTPTKESDNSNTYSFVGWDSDVPYYCYDSKTYKAVFKADGIDYIVIFKDYNGGIISTNVYSYGESVIAPTDPTRDADETYTYEFAGWDKEVVACVGDA